MLTNAIVMGKFNELHDVLLLGITQYKNCRLFKMYTLVFICGGESWLKIAVPLSMDKVTDITVG